MGQLVDLAFTSSAQPKKQGCELSRSVFVATTLLSSCTNHTLRYFVPWVFKAVDTEEESEPIQTVTLQGQLANHSYTYTKYIFPEHTVRALHSLFDLLRRPDECLNETVLGNLQLIVGELLINGESNDELRYEIHKYIAAHDWIQESLVKHVKYDAIQAILINLLKHDGFVKSTDSCPDLNHLLELGYQLYKKMCYLMLAANSETLSAILRIFSDLVKNNFKIHDSARVIKLILSSEANLQVVMDGILAPLQTTLSQESADEDIWIKSREFVNYLTTLVRYNLKDFDTPHDGGFYQHLESEDEDMPDTSSGDEETQQGDSALENIQISCKVTESSHEQAPIYSLILKNMDSLRKMFHTKHQVRVGLTSEKGPYVD